MTGRPSDAVSAIAAGKMAVLLSGDGPQESGYLVIAADAVTPQTVAFYLRHTSGVIGVALTGERADALELKSAARWPGDPILATPTMPVDLAARVDRGSSATDRAGVIAALVDADTRPGELIGPGHVYPLRAADAGVLARRDPAAASLDLARLGGRASAGVIAPILREEDGEVARGEHLRRFAASHELPLISLDALIAYRTNERPAIFVAAIRLPTGFGDFACYVWETPDGAEQLALTRLESIHGSDVPAAVHQECRPGHALRSLRCDCKARLEHDLTGLRDGEIDVLVYVRGPATRIDLGCVRAPRGPHTRPDDNSAGGSLLDARSSVICAQILDELPLHSWPADRTSA